MQNSCRSGSTTYLVSFRHESPTNVGQADSLRVTVQILICWSVNAHVSEAAKEKGVLKESVRGCDLFIMVDVTNYSLTYRVNGYENHMSRTITIRI